MRPKSMFVQLWCLVMVNVLAICMAQDYTFVVEESGHTMVCESFTAMKVNGTIPGPTLSLTYGQTVAVNVINNASYGLTIHWHGVKQPRNPWSDGPEYVTQCPIQPGSNFTYEIILSDEEGTLWWHAHSEWSRATVYGALVINPTETRPNPYSIQPDAEQEIIIATWFDRNVKDITEGYHDNGAALPMDFKALTLNGKPGDTYNTEDGCIPEMFELEVEPKKAYLLRIINAAMNEDLAFGVAGHNLTLVGTDGAYIEPIETDHIMIFSGQTMDVILVANQPHAYYYMEAKFIVGGSDGSSMITRGVVKYANTIATPPIHTSLPAVVDVASFTAQFQALNDSNYDYDVPQTVDTNIIMTVSLNLQECDDDQTCTTKAAASLNNVTFVAPDVDVLQAYYLNLTSSYKTDFPTKVSAFDYTDANGLGRFSEVNGTRVFVVDYNSTVEMVFQGTNILVPTGVAHPIHVHGYSFYPVAWGLGNFNESDVTYNLVDPPLVNNVALPANGWTAIRFRADNPGVWFMHCHLERHSFVGMDAVMIVTNGTDTETSILPPPYTPTGTCA